MARQIDGVALGSVFAGSLLMYAGITGKSVPAALQAIVKGQSPKTATTAYPISGSPATGSNSPVSSGGYVNPFGGVANLVPERVDMGVDFSGSGLVTAIGSGRITNVSNFGWPNSTFICIHLDTGAYAGKYFYFAEDISPAVQPGDQVSAGQVIGTMFNGGSGIECGWAAPPGIGATMAAINLQWPNAGSRSTAYGVSANRLLTSLGVPSGQINGTPVGSVGAGYP